MIRSGRGTLAIFMAWGLTLACASAGSAQQADGYARSSRGTRVLELGSGTVIEMLLDASNLESDEPVKAVAIWVPGGEGDRIAPANRWTRIGATDSRSSSRVAAGVEAQNQVDPRDEEERAVIAAAQALFDAMGALDAEALRDSMVPDGFLMAVGFETTRRTSRDDFAARFADQTRPMIERMWDPEVRIDGPVATLWAPYDFYSALEFSHCGTDSFQLAKTPEGWKVVIVSYTVQMPPTCNTHPGGPPA